MYQQHSEMQIKDLFIRLYSVYEYANKNVYYAPNYFK